MNKYSCANMCGYECCALPTGRLQPTETGMLDGWEYHQLGLMSYSEPDCVWMEE
jgi:hypothetical protein